MLRGAAQRLAKRATQLAVTVSAWVADDAFLGCGLGLGPSRRSRVLVRA